MKSRGLLPLLYLSFIALLYGNSLTGGFLIDDAFLVRDNPFIESFSHLLSYFSSANEEFGRPVRLLSFYFDTAIFGKNPAGYHLSNILYYLLFSYLAFLFVERLFEKRFLSITVALLFIAHPLHTEGVAYISGRKDILGGIFCFAALISFLRYLSDSKRRDLLAVALFFLMAIASKEIYAILPLLLVMTAYYRGEGLKRYAGILAGFMLVAGIFLLYVILFRNRVLFDYFHTIPVYGAGKGMNLPTAIKICGYIFYLTFIPQSLSADYTFNVIKRVSFFDLSFLISMAMLVSAAAGAYLSRRREREISFGLFWMLICLLPVCHIITYPEIISERSLIFCSFGTCLVVGKLLMMMRSRKAAILLLILILLAFSAKTITRNAVWKDDLSLWSATVGTVPHCARARYNLGIALARRCRFQEAEQQFLSSLAINPPKLITVPDYSYDALLNLANTCAVMGRFGTARQYYRLLLAHDPRNQTALRNLHILKEASIQPPCQRPVLPTPRSQ